MIIEDGVVLAIEPSDVMLLKGTLIFPDEASTMIDNCKLGLSKEIAATIETIDFNKVKTIGYIENKGYSNVFSNLQHINAPKCEVIRGNLFNGCTKLKSVNIPMVKEIWTYAFQGCTSLTDVDLPVCKQVGMSAFRQCQNLNKVKFGNAIESIDVSAFERCDIREVDVKNASVHLSAFQDNIRLSRVRVSSLDKVAKNAFFRCKKLEVITCAEENTFSAVPYTDEGKEYKIEFDLNNGENAEPQYVICGEHELTMSFAGIYRQTIRIDSIGAVVYATERDNAYVAKFNDGKIITFFGMESLMKYIEHNRVDA